jgi:hypothetical protein
MPSQPQAIWQFIRPNQYSRPAEPASEVVRKGIWGMWDRLRQQRPSHDNAIMGQENLRQVPAELLQQAAPKPDWNSALPALATALDQWLETPEPSTPLQVLVGPPYCGIPEMVTAWAHTHDWCLLKPPTPSQILAGARGWFNNLDTDNATPLVIPSLERCYLRHQDGFSLLHRLTEWLAVKRIRCLIACNSWAWAYFRKVFEVDVFFPSLFTLQGLDHTRLQHWFRLLISGADPSGLHFLQADNGKPVLPINDHDTDGDTSEQPPQDKDHNPQSNVTDFLKYVAGTSRGIPGIAWAIWRRSLQFAAENAKANDGDTESGTVFWVKPWSQLALPSFHSPHDQSALLVVHALLLHGSLPNEALRMVLPLNPKEIMHNLHSLRIQGLIDRVQDRWYITPAGYPAVRRVLESEGYLIDEF